MAEVTTGKKGYDGASKWIAAAAMAMEQAMRNLDAYRKAGEGIHEAGGRDGGKVVYTVVEGRSVMDFMFDGKGSFDPRSAAQNVMASEVNPELFRELMAEFIKARIEIAGGSIVEPAREGEEFARMRSFLFFPKDRAQEANAVIDGFISQRHDRDPMTKEELYDWIRTNDGDTSAAYIDVDRELYRFMSRSELISAPRAEMDMEDAGVVRVITSKNLIEGISDTVRLAGAVYSGGFKAEEEEKERSVDGTLSRLLADAKNDMHSSIIVNAGMPAEFVKLGKDGYEYYMTTGAGPQLIERRDRNYLHYEEDLYRRIHSFEGFREFTGREDEMAKALRSFQAEDRGIKGITVEERVHELKKWYSEDIERMTRIVGEAWRGSLEPAGRGRDGAYDGRMKDDVIKINNRISELSARGLGASQAAGDLRDDKAQIQGMIRAALDIPAPESTKDLSDLYGGTGIDDFLRAKLALDIYDRDRREKILHEFDYMKEGLARETEEVRVAFMKEAGRTVWEVFDRDYRYGEEPAMEHGTLDLSREITQDGMTKETEITRPHR